MRLLMNTIFSRNYEGPLYAPHPDLIKKVKLVKEGLTNTKEDENEIIYDDYSDPFGGH